jgi:two-component system, OmpR family, sensor histidine kinase MprB
VSLRRRMSLVSAVTVAVAICVASAIAYFAVRSELRSQVDDELRRGAERVGGIASQAPDILRRRGGIAKALNRSGRSELNEGLPPPQPGFVAALGGPDFFFQLIPPDGTPVGPPGPAAVAAPLDLPVDADTARIAATGEGEALQDRDVGDTHVRVLTLGAGGAGAIQLGSSLEGTDDVLASLRVVLFLVVMGGIGVAALLARRVADRAVAPIARLTEAAEHVGETEDLSRRIDAQGPDEVGRLANRFNAMLDTLARSRADLAASVDAQRQLVADASHELRTPVASLRTDIEVLRDGRALDDADRAAMLGDVDDRVEELGALITDVIELARGDETEEGVEEVRLDLVATECVGRARRHFPSHELVLDASPSVVEARPDRLARAINNLLDNAAKFGPEGSPVEVRVAEGEVSVRDHGPGVPATERELIFDRFHRGSRSRSTAGSGLGLAIVRQVVRAHGGEATVEDAPGGGALFRLRLPVAAPEADPDTSSDGAAEAKPSASVTASR